MLPRKQEKERGNTLSPKMLYKPEIGGKKKEEEGKKAPQKLPWKTKFR